MNQLTENKNSPWTSLFILFGLMLACSVGLQLIVLLIAGGIYGINTGHMPNMEEISAYQQNSYLLYTLLFVSSLSTFLLPSIILQNLEPYSVYFLRKNITKGLFYVLAIALMIAFGPLMQLVGEANASMKLPESLAGMEEWMMMKEKEMGTLTAGLIMVKDWWALPVNLLVMAVMPAIAEEFFFRGTLMQIAQRFVKNQHLSIWIIAIVFSAIHVQFYGFFPRMILGVFFGYMLLWSQNIWVPVLAHFVNNATVVVIAFMYAKQGKAYSDLQSYESYPIFVYLGSLILTIAFGWWFFKISKQNNRIHGARLGED